jgi:hypothetical protein
VNTPFSSSKLLPAFVSPTPTNRPSSTLSTKISITSLPVSSSFSSSLIYHCNYLINRIKTVLGTESFVIIQKKIDECENRINDFILEKEKEVENGFYFEELNKDIPSELCSTDDLSDIDNDKDDTNDAKLSDDYLYKTLLKESQSLSTLRENRMKNKKHKKILKEAITRKYNYFKDKMSKLLNDLNDWMKYISSFGTFISSLIELTKTV